MQCHGAGQELVLIDSASQPLILPNLLFGGMSQLSHLIIWSILTLLGHRKLFLAAWLAVGQALSLPGS